LNHATWVAPDGSGKEGAFRSQYEHRWNPTLNFDLAPPGAPRSEPFTAELPEGTDLGIVLGQDVSVMATAQLGLHQPGRTHLLVSDEECRVINLNRNLDEWLG